MIRLTKQCDYGIVLLAELSCEHEQESLNARELSERSQLPLPMVSKILKELVRGGLLDSHRGAHGGYSLAKPAEHITLSEIVDVLEGPLALTDCCEHSPGCYRETCCKITGVWQEVNDRIRRVFDDFTLAELVQASQLRLPSDPGTGLEAGREGL